MNLQEWYPCRTLIATPASTLIVSLMVTLATALKGSYKGNPLPESYSTLYLTETPF